MAFVKIIVEMRGVMVRRINSSEHVAIYFPSDWSQEAVPPACCSHITLHEDRPSSVWLMAGHTTNSLQECDREFGMDAKHASCLMIREQPSFLRAADASLWMPLKHC
jgi:hypothetical protein